MIFVHGMRPNFKSIARAYGALAVLAVVAYGANSMIGPGANYLFLAKPEDTPSILDILPPQPCAADPGDGGGGDGDVRTGVFALVSDGPEEGKSGGLIFA